MDVSQLNRSRVNESRLNWSVLNASGFDGACRRSRVPGIGADIMKSMVLWYDIAKQGATNESMAENPVLRDLSGNGHDATCYNFAWSGMSGVGGYGQNFTTWNIQNGSYEELINRTYNSISIRLTNVPSNNRISLTFVKKTNYSASKYKVKVHSTNNNLEFILRFLFDNGLPEKIINLIQNVETDIQLTEEEYINLQDNTPILAITNGDSASIDDEITLEQLPLYPNALVSDGVDDYCLVEGLPLLNKEDGYTVIAKRKRLSNMGCLASKRNTALTNGAFVFELSVNGEDKRCDSFDGRNQISSFADTISWQTKNSYNGKPIGVGDEEDNDVLRLFLLYDHYYCQVALYSLLLFNRDLTPEEIEWVKTNLIEAEQ